MHIDVCVCVHTCAGCHMTERNFRLELMQQTERSKHKERERERETEERMGMSDGKDIWGLVSVNQVQFQRCYSSIIFVNIIVFSPNLMAEWEIIRSFVCVIMTLFSLVTLAPC